MSDDRTPPDGPPSKAKDIVVVQGPTPHGVAVVRVQAEEGTAKSVEVGELRPLVEGQPIQGDVLKLTPHADEPRVFDAEVVAKKPSGRATPPRAEAAPHKGPPRVATDAYRENWDGIFGRRAQGGAPN